MNPFNHRFAGFLVLGLATIALVAFLVSTKRFNPYPDGKSPSNVQTTIEVSLLEKLLPSGKNPQRYLDIFMVKDSKDAWKRDFSFCIFIRGRDGKEVSIDKDYSESRFQSQSSNYIQWLYQQKVNVKYIPHSYLIDLATRKLETGSSIRISISPLPGYQRQASAHFMDAMNTPMPNDSGPVCPCPPGPCTNCPGHEQSTPSLFVEQTLRKQYKIPLETRTQ